MINDHLKMSAAGLQLLKDLESCRKLPYDDQTGKSITRWMPTATIGYGHLILGPEWESFKNGISAKTANDLLASDIASRENAVKRAINQPLKQHQYDACLILTYNIGATAMKQSSVTKLINDPQAVTPHASLELAWMAWNKSKGKIMRGLTLRRAIEWRLFSSGIYHYR